MNKLSPVILTFGKAAATNSEENNGTRFGRLHTPKNTRRPEINVAPLPLL